MFQSHPKNGPDQDIMKPLNPEGVLPLLITEVLPQQGKGTTIFQHPLGREVLVILLQGVAVLPEAAPSVPVAAHPGAQKALPVEVLEDLEEGEINTPLFLPFF